jgi:hypothetical protein
MCLRKYSGIVFSFKAFSRFAFNVSRLKFICNCYKYLSWIINVKRERLNDLSWLYEF